MDFRKIKRLHAEYEKELRRLSQALTARYDREIGVTPTTDGICVIFADQDDTGVTLEDFEQMMKEPGFDTRSITTVL